MSILSKLFGGGGASKPTAEPTKHEGFTIYPEPIPEGGQFRVAARIEKEIDGETKVHRLIRADTISDEQAAVEASTAKAKQLIEEQGERLFS